MIDERYIKIAEKTGMATQYNRMGVIKGSVSDKRSSMHYIKGDVVKIKPGDGSSKMTKELAKELTAEAENFESKIGELKHLKSVKSKRYANNNHWGGYNDNSGDIVLRGVGGENGKATMIKVAKEMKKAGNWSTSSPYHVYRHELAHCWLQGQKEIDGFASKITQVENIKSNMLRRLTNDEKSDKILMKNELSVYGLMPDADIDDFIAECIAEFLTNKPRKMAKDVVGILLKE